MPNDQNSSSSAVTHFNPGTARQLLLALCISSVSWVAMAATGPQDANARYQAERAACMSGQSNQSRATCLREAGAALQEARRGRLQDDPTADSQNALLRCNALPPDDKDACQRRINGEGTTSGSVLEGGVLRELTVTVPDRK
ncbi:hypothetical protein SAMN04515620_14132 [Collimonas sp. OK607]|uniref:hypothetical protein n=1 Tax=Collimonas sp. OK607 TaxID=1798194 RepID=UPI0008E4045F|nr:hypothetical protein [Collimonas sp. OK607]SFB31822.1 hypothetical protein SAMN04515620_14132 [Collimonas sp. OK607]